MLYLDKTEGGKRECLRAERSVLLYESVTLKPAVLKVMGFTVLGAVWVSLKHPRQALGPCTPHPEASLAHKAVLSAHNFDGSQLCFGDSLLEISVPCAHFQCRTPYLVTRPESSLTRDPADPPWTPFSLVP